MQTLDILAEGFSLKYEEKPTLCYTKPVHSERKGSDTNRDVLYNPRNNWVLVCEGDDETSYSDWITRFSGVIETQEDFHRLLTQLQ